MVTSNYDAKRDWVRAHLADLNSDAEMLTGFAKAFAFPDEDQASDELKAILGDEAATEEQFADSITQRHWALGQRLLAMCIADKQHGAAAQIWKTMSQLKGLEHPQQLEVSVSAVPPSEIRARIQKLLADEHVRERAQQAEIDLAELAGDQPKALPEPYDPRDGRASRALDPVGLGENVEDAEVVEVAPSTQSAEPQERSHDVDPPINPLAEFVAPRLPPETKA